MTANHTASQQERVFVPVAGRDNIKSEIARLKRLNSYWHGDSQVHNRVRELEQQLYR